MGSNTYAILKWQLVDSTYGTIGEYQYTSSWAHDHFFMNEGNNQYFVYIVRKFPSGWTAGTSSSSTYAPYGGITSYYRFGFIRMKHHLRNSYKLYLLMKPAYKEYSASVPSSFVQGYREVNYFGTWSINSMDTQAKISGWNGWPFVSVHAGNNTGGYSNLADDPA